MKRAVLTTHQIVAGDPPWPYLTWDEGAVQSWLHQQGFDVDGVIWRTKDPCRDQIVFEQEEAGERRKPA